MSEAPPEGVQSQGLRSRTPGAGAWRKLAWETEQRGLPLLAAAAWARHTAGRLGTGETAGRLLPRELIYKGD